MRFEPTLQTRNVGEKRSMRSQLLKDERRAQPNLHLHPRNTNLSFALLVRFLAASTVRTSTMSQKLGWRHIFPLQDGGSGMSEYLTTATFLPIPSQEPRRVSFGLLGEKQIGHDGLGMRTKIAERYPSVTSWLRQIFRVFFRRSTLMPGKLHFRWMVWRNFGGGRTHDISLARKSWRTPSG